MCTYSYTLHCNNDNQKEGVCGYIDNKEPQYCIMIIN